MEIKNQRMVRISKKDGEEERSIMSLESSEGICVTASVEGGCHMIYQNRNMK